MCGAADGGRLALRFRYTGAEKLEAAPQGRTEGVVSMYCTNCGAELDEDTRFCPFCGKRVVRPAHFAPQRALSSDAAAEITGSLDADPQVSDPDATVRAAHFSSAASKLSDARDSHAAGAADGASPDAAPQASDPAAGVGDSARSSAASVPGAHDSEAASLVAGTGSAPSPEPEPLRTVSPTAAQQGAQAAVAPGDTASFTAPLPPSVPQDDIVYSGRPVRRRGAGETALIAVAGVAVVAAVILCAWMATGHTLPFFSPAQSTQDDAANAAPAGTDLTPLQVSVAEVNVDSYPTVAVDLAFAVPDGAPFDASKLTAADFTVTETAGGSAESVAATVDRFTAGNGGTSRLVYTSGIDPAAAAGDRTVEVALNELSGYAGSVTAPARVVPSDEGADEDSPSQEAPGDEEAAEAVAAAAADPSGHLVPHSDTHQYTADEFAGYSDWDLYVARNEIFARHGRGFSNADLQAYFDGKTWYHEQYAPEEFDAMTSPLNDTEKANVATIRSLEESRGSSYL